MTCTPGQPSSRSRDDHDDSMIGRLDVPGAPDLTRSIMGRLGYMQVTPRVARRRRIRRWAGRCSLLALAALAVGLGIQAHQSSPDARHPVPVTMPGAVSRDIEDHQIRFGTMLRLIREIPAPLEFDPDAELAPDASPEQNDAGPGSEVDDEVNRSAIAPVRWV